VEDHDNEPELNELRHQMQETRSSLAEKLDALESKVLSPVQDATEAVANTVEDVKEVVESVTESVQETVETVKETFNFSDRVREHPWLMFGGAFTAGFLGGWFFLPRREERMTLTPTAYQPQPEARVEQKEEQEDEGFAPLQMVKGLAIGTLMGVIREMLTGALPANLTGNVRQMVDEFTTQLGGNPITSSEREQESSPAEEHNGRRETPAAAKPEAPPKTEEHHGRSDRRRAGTRGH